MKGVDQNNNPLYDAKVNVTVKSKDMLNTYEDYVIIPDTLWQHNMNLESIGATILTLPDSIFPPATLTYQVVCIFTNTAQERIEKSFNATYSPEKTIKHESIGDSLKFDASAPGSFTVYRYGTLPLAFDSISFDQSITIPLTPYTHRFEVREKNHFIDNILTKTIDDSVHVSYQRSMDSLWVTITNPRKLPIRYQLFKKNKIVDQNFVYSHTIKKCTSIDDNYTLSIQYMWAGEALSEHYNFNIDKKELTVELLHPTTVFPGEKVNYTVQVKDFKSKPVANADITSHGLTSKFKATTPQIPMFGNLPNRKITNTFTTNTTSTNFLRNVYFSSLTKKLGLDSVTYYQLLTTDSIFYHTQPTPNSSTQVAPFLFSYGYVTEPIYVEIDNVIVYYGSAEKQPYSFKIHSLNPRIKIRTASQIITLKRITLTPGVKNIVGVNKENATYAHVTNLKEPKFQYDEVQKINNQYLKIIQPEKSYLQQENQFYLIPKGSRESVIGPFKSGLIHYQGSFNLQFDFKRGYAYELKPGLIDRASNTIASINYLPYAKFDYTFNDMAHTKANALKLLEHEPVKIKLSIPTLLSDYYTGHIMFLENDEPNLSAAHYLINLDIPNYHCIIPSGKLTKNKIAEGKYLAYTFLDDGSYSTKHVTIEVNATTYLNISSFFHDSDSVSSSIYDHILDQSISHVYVSGAVEEKKHAITQSILTTQRRTGNIITGVIMDQDGEFIPGAVIIEKGTTNGTYSNEDGEFELQTDEGTVLLISFIGYITQEVRAKSYTQIIIEADIQRLEEVVVVGYGVQERKMLVGSAPGITITSPRYRYEDLKTIYIRGANAIQGNAKPLVIIDGVIQSLDNFDPSLAEEIIVLNNEESIAIYGSQAANGVIVISTKKTNREQLIEESKKAFSPMLIPEESKGSSLRRNFKDYAFWQPSLKTNKHGEAHFEVTMPDDISAWDTKTLVMASRRRTGSYTSKLKSFKPLLAEVAIPKFLVTSDTTFVYGKITNYGSDPIRILRFVSDNLSNAKDSSLSITNSHIDTLSLIATNTDSLEIVYRIQYNRYEDGELKRIPILPAGTYEYIGKFASLPSDTTFQWSFDNESPLTVQVYHDAIDVFQEEITALMQYPYNCHEQLASKLSAFLWEQQYKLLKKESFDGKKEIEKIIKTLSQQQNTDGGWGWWPNNSSSLWISQHVVEQLNNAEKLGYYTQHHKENALQYLEEKVFSLKGIDQIRLLEYLKINKSKIAFHPEFDSSYVNTKREHIYKLYYERLQQLSEKQVNWEWVKQHQSSTLKGNIYWGKSNGTDLLYNDVEATLLLYRMVKHESKKEIQPHLIENYFIEKKQTHVYNTYESARILNAIFPSLLERKAVSNPEVLINEDRVISFPYTTTLSTRALSIKKGGEGAVYVTAFQRFWNENPLSQEEYFSITTTFDNEKPVLTVGKPIVQKVNIHVMADANYVIISIPIPAGCTYLRKEKSRLFGEVYREYDNHEVRIYCESMPKGKYEYAFQLLPQFAGRYTVNPATIKPMYFPTLQGIQEKHQIQITN